MLYLAINVSKCYEPPNSKLISKDLLDEIHDQNMERNLNLIKRESNISGLIFLGDRVTIYRTPLLNILMSGKNSSICIITCLFPGTLKT